MGELQWYPMFTPSPINLSQTPAVLYPQQSTTWKGQGFPLLTPPQDRSSSATPASLIGRRPDLYECASQTIQLPPQPGPCLPRQPDIPLHVWSNFVYHYRHHTIHYWHHNLLKRNLHVIMYNKTRIHYFIKM